MKKRGFTLVELLAVLVLISALTLIAVPSIINYINKNKSEISSVTEQLIIVGADLYVSDNSSLFSKDVGSQYCVTLKDIVDAKYLSAPIMDSVTNQEIDLNKFVKVNYDYDNELKINKFNYELTDTCNQIIKACTVVVGDGTNIGDEIACGTEHFYVVSNDGNKITMLAKYNLKVGRIHTSETEYTEIPTTEEGYGLQDSEMIGWISSGYPYKGTIGFSSSSYWTDTPNAIGGNLLEKYGTGYPTYVYDENSNLYQHVENYEAYLKDNGVSSAGASLMSYEQVVALGCYADEIDNDCTLAPSWVYSTSYWLGSSAYTSEVWNVGSGCDFYHDVFSHDYLLGVRPVVTIDINQIKLKMPK